MAPGREFVQGQYQWGIVEEVRRQGDLGGELAVQGVEQLRSALRAAADRQGPTLIEINQGLWMQEVAV